ncbi:monovalent cation/H+ antiporter complex subunit F [Vallicoccus soli]|uniref:Cation:proton antiporter n=1 Tax=Vallicoccus soli TaxID=2339232 RepID=A0A3A3YWJ6_9ACTN|nr:monovalent cation/H+ antiporter complex subunit F [Vallicoccus soli]RJK95978.1 cation:proton antiporter [Vallicoccus soli]
MTVVGVVVAVLLSAAAALCVLRMLRGPATLDRVVATDMLLAVVVCGLAAYAAVTRASYVVPVAVVVALLGFTGSTSIARSVGRQVPPPPAPRDPA